ncbi:MULTISPECIES: hypothetical protein [Nocardia]|uniref:hypothetical protein n=1 Tax=Nocardia TaxID=1817 RepID=UPI0007EB557F|nr:MULTISPECIES: hypothetical protein [Nocardia]MBF6272947.1 hypothetical protein [Nocardia nova]OBA44139.1 hypothetical protein A5789_09720 [Nocardia sp. 852002-51101_SCH5132738]OBB43975.1 hypothetical protein A5748_28265 [Nocardia sp. 852002-51244_SCH5132740]OBF64930.1 hypothetical protein A9X06_08495 [Mycobacterium sp. 852002-51759_SCH5129042]
MTALDEPLGFTNPDYYRDAASHTERQLRADFARYYQLREIAPSAATAEARAEFNSRADELAIRWARHESEHWRGTWAGLQRVVAGWRTQPEIARRNYDHIARARATGEVAIDDDIWRTLQQARLITGHGTGTITGSNQDAARRYPYLQPNMGATLAPTTRADTEIDRRTAVERTLGAPRDPAVALPSLAQVDAVIADTDALLETEETAADLDDGREARKMLLPRAVREAPISADYSDTETWQRRHAEALREVQDLAAEHSTIADGLNGVDDQARIARLDRLSAARRDALAIGLTDAQVHTAYTTGRDGTYWATQPSDPQLGRIAQLLEHRDAARAAADTYRTQLTRTTAAQAHASVTATDTAMSVTHSTSVEAGGAVQLSHSDVGAGAAISRAVDTALPDPQSGEWSPAVLESAAKEIVAETDREVSL